MATGMRERFFRLLGGCNAEQRKSIAAWLCARILRNAKRCGLTCRLAPSQVAPRIEACSNLSAAFPDAVRKHCEPDLFPSRAGQCAHDFILGSSQSRRLSPNRLKANTASVMARPGNRIIHGAVW